MTPDRFRILHALPRGSTPPTNRAGLTYGFMDNTPVDQMYNEAYILNPHEELEPKIKRVAKLPLTNQPGE